MIWIEKQYRHLLQNLDLVITEASSMRQDGIIRRHQQTGQIFGHAGVPNLISLFSNFTKKIVFVHFGSWFYKDIKSSQNQFKELAKKYSLDIIVGYDGLEVEF